MRSNESFDVRCSAFGVRAAALLLAATAVAFVAYGASRTVSAQPADGAKVYADNCASCHDQPTGRTPPKDALKERTADAIHLSLTSGTMAIQGLSLTVAERKAVSEYLSGKPLGTTSAQDAGLCAAKPAPLGNLASKPQWNGWGVDSSTRATSRSRG